MASRSSRSPPILFATKPTSSDSSQTFSVVRDAITSPKSSSTLLSLSLGGLDALQNILEAVDTLPCIKYIAGISIKVLQIIQEVQSTNDAVRKIGLRAKDIVLAVARSCANAAEEVLGQLESDLQQLTETMNDIFDFTQEMASRRTYQKIWNKADDAAAVQSLDVQLTHAFQIFEIQSSVSLRISQQQMVRQLSGISIAQHSPLVTSHPLRIIDGLYLIRNAADGRVIETEHRRPAPSYLHACVAPSSDGLSPYQIWLVSAKHNRETDYTISNFATGASLDVFCGHTQDGTQVICQASHAGPNQTWSLYGSRASDLFDYCTIRSHGPPTVLDGQCPAGSGCDYLHMTSLRDVNSPRLSQEWALIRLPLSLSSSRLPVTPMIPSSLDPTLPRRRLILQNVASGSYATLAPSSGRDRPNIVMQSHLEVASSWYFKHVVQDDGQYDDAFTIIAGSPPALASLNVYGGRYIAANPRNYEPGNSYHMWKAIPKNGGFCFRNIATDKLLSQSSLAPAMHVADPAQFDDASCQWRLLDATTGAICPILYDSALAVPPSELSGTLTGSEPPQHYPQELMLRASDATPTIRRSFVDGLKREHSMIREMLTSGYTSLVLAPRLITGWKTGVGLYDVTRRDEDAAFGLKRFRGKGSFDTCVPIRR